MKSTSAGSRTPEESLRFWDGFAPNYLKKPEGRDPYAEAFYMLSGIREGESIFDMGCGPGTLAVPFAKKGHRIVAADFSRGMLEQLAEYAREECVEDMITPLALRDLPLCDMAICSRALIVYDLPLALDKLESVAKRKVCLGLVDPPETRSMKTPEICRYVTGELEERGKHYSIQYIKGKDPHVTAHVSWDII